MGEKVIEQETFKIDHQSIGHRVFYDIEYHDNEKNCFVTKHIKLELESDGFRQQCYARASVLEGTDWHLLYTIPPYLMNTKESLNLTYDRCPQNAEKEFSKDVKKLKEMVKYLLS